MQVLDYLTGPPHNFYDEEDSVNGGETTKDSFVGSPGKKSAETP
jgi:hypothetical protein